MRHAYPRATLPPLTHLILVVGKTKKQYCKIRSVSRACRTCLFSCRVRFTVYIPQWSPIGWNVAYDRLAFAVRSDARDVLVRQSNVFNQVTNVNVPVNIDFSGARRPGRLTRRSRSRRKSTSQRMAETWRPRRKAT